MFQLGSALLDACVLAILARDDAYGYSLTQEIKEIIPVSESTLYPVLRRLQTEGALSTYDQPFNGRNRRYYHISVEGRKKVKALSAEWDDFSERIDRILGGGAGPDGKEAR